MRYLDVYESQLIYINGGGKGTQPKYKINNEWIKEDLYGDEGLVEYLISLVLFYSTLPEDSYITYEQLLVRKNYDNTNVINACVSTDFTNGGTVSFVTLLDLYKKCTGRSLSQDIKDRSTIQDRIVLVTEFCKRFLGYDISTYLSRVFTLDYVSLNIDRHLRNIGVFRTFDNHFIDSKIFDNGLSLYIGNVKYDRNKSIKDNFSNVDAKPFSHSLNKQMNIFGQAFKLDYIGLLGRLKLEPASFRKNVLIERLFYIMPDFSDFNTVGLFYQGKQIGTAIKSANNKYITEYIIKSQNNIEVSINKDIVIIPSNYQGIEINPTLIDNIRRGNKEYFMR